ncbi:MAG: prepilin-type N-terminal cleavage/methylation domain-containing protein, partial [Candidatus Omnitrophica bacterium]|nr:prepilin-type N-terminal cleavage/methylation domain-containing protein [Candidatus Omnitrophota bacterium]
MINTMDKKGITLTELIVASILIGIVMIGVAAFSASIEQLHTSTNRSTILTMKTTATMNHITRAAYLAVGDE